ncbi:hypothetical protein AVEN_101931-1 [Araneus ventricosus]|uniref:Uncharacterized protein n=1 Tax=Araneus ventricosus TaxID=182803 RepID=A0A4Y2DA21_ARAVE|nr:hypothetical protein AVEN_101931-1 [Araneus ventricosus]
MHSGRENQDQCSSVTGLGLKQIKYGFRSTSELPQDQTRGQSANKKNTTICWKVPNTFPEIQVNFRKIRPEVRVCPHKNRNPTWEKFKFKSENSHETTLVPVPRAAKIDLFPKPKSTFFINRFVSSTARVFISFHKASKGSERHLSRLFHLSRRPVSRPQSVKSSPFVFSYEYCIFHFQTYWILHQSTPVLGNIFSGDGLCNQVRHCPLPNVLAHIEQCCVRYHLQP